MSSKAAKRRSAYEEREAKRQFKVRANSCPHLSFVGLCDLLSADLLAGKTGSNITWSMCSQELCPKEKT